MSSRTEEQIGLLHQRWTLGDKKSTKSSLSKTSMHRLRGGMQRHSSKESIILS